MSRDSTKLALDRFFTKQSKLDSMKATPRKNQKPEFSLTVVPLIEWFETAGWSMDVIESKAVYNVQAGRYLEGQTIAGMPDMVGCTSSGIGAFVEAKAPGKLSTLRPAQRQYLTDKIKLGAFAAVTDSVQRLERIYLGWQTTSDQNRIKYLLDQLPPEPKRRNDKFNDELGF
jgi:hypothetical protein